MNLRTLALLTLVSLLPTALHAKDRHLFILSGQSNMQGLNPQSSFLPELKRLLPNADIQHVKFARGGQPIRKWVKTYDEIAKKHKLSTFKDPAAFYDTVLKAAKENIAQGKPKTITFLWMQGERDGKTGLAAAYEDAMKTLIANLRKDLNAPEMKFVIGRLCDHLNHEQWNGVRAAQVKVATDDKWGAWVDTDDTNDKERNGKKWNDLHYTKAGYDLFGQRLARQAVRMIRGEKPDPQGRPE